MHDSRQAIKRVFDLSAASAALLILSPLMLLTATLVWLLDGKPVLFRQVRAGLHGKPFTIYKFRTMTDARNAQGGSLPDVDRLTRLGAFLRRTSLDELPQLWNVVRGEMSLVGPRPLRMEYLPLYTSEQARRHNVRPGIAGWAQVNGRNQLTWEEKFEMDVWYVDNQNLLLDLRILCLTVSQVLTRKGINAPGYATMPPFAGSGKLEADRNE
jgi:sugar transferase EpsL